MNNSAYLKDGRVLGAILSAYDKLLNSRVPEPQVVECGGRQVSVRPSDSMGEIVVTAGVQVDRRSHLLNRRSSLRTQLSRYQPLRGPDGARIFSDKQKAEIKAFKEELSAVEAELDSPSESHVTVLAVGDIAKFIEEALMQLLLLTRPATVKKKPAAKPAPAPAPEPEPEPETDPLPAAE